MKKNALICCMVVLSCISVSHAQNAAKKLPDGWHLLDKATDNVYGISLDRAYDFLKDKKSKTVVVAIIDSGIDTLHEDLKNVLWVNSREIAGNGIDDDRNGYVDDVHGWNLIGGKDGRNVVKDSYEFIRIYEKFLNRYKNIDTASLQPNEKDQYFMWAKTSAMVEQLIKSIGDEKKAREMYIQASQDFRGPIVNDNENDVQDRFYGNNDIMTAVSMHATHVAGIIGGDRTNNTGVNGIANNVRIMTIRTIPDGDEHDKDIASAIRYAVDNGAKVINMSFYKNFSPNKPWIDDAVQYAESKGVLMIHAAGNENADIDVHDIFPNPKIKGTNKVASNWINVGASADATVASFSNYGKKQVDVFAPGVGIYSTLPGNKYGRLDGTSMATPIVTGIAALIFSYFPDLTYKEVKEAIVNSVVMPDTLSRRPGGSQMVHMSDVSSAGGIVNAYNAVKLAAELEKKRSGKKRK